MFVVVLGAAVGAGAVYLLDRRGYWRWWAFALTGVVIGTLPGLMYLWAVSGHDEWLPLVIAMLVTGAIWGALVIAVLFFMLKPKSLSGVA